MKYNFLKVQLRTNACRILTSKHVKHKLDSAAISYLLFQKIFISAINKYSNYFYNCSADRLIGHCVSQRFSNLFLRIKIAKNNDL